MLFCNLQDKENSVSQNQQAPVKRGPKVNGVRRALVPQAGSKQKIGAMGENKEIIIPSQGEGLSGSVPTAGKIKSTTNASNSPATPQMQPPNLKIGSAQQGIDDEGARVNGQPPRSGTTFVVDPSKHIFGLFFFRGCQMNVHSHLSSSVA